MTEHASQTALFVLAHADDDLMVWPMLRRLRQTHTISIIYITDMIQNYGSRRVEEAQNTLGLLGIDNIHFVGNDIDASDGRTIDKADSLLNKISEVVDREPPLDLIVTHAMEGGNPDHDLAFCLSTVIAKRSKTTVTFMATPFYRKHNLSILPYTVQKPLTNVPLGVYSASIADALAVIPASRFYRSQAFVLAALLPFYILKVLFRRGVLFHSSQNPEDYFANLEDTSMIERQYKDTPEAFYTRLKLWLERQNNLRSQA